MEFISSTFNPIVPKWLSKLKLNLSNFYGMDGPKKAFNLLKQISI